jgi:hypothetical protein
MGTIVNLASRLSALSGLLNEGELDEALLKRVGIVALESAMSQLDFIQRMIKSLQSDLSKAHKKGDLYLVGKDSPGRKLANIAYMVVLTAAMDLQDLMPVTRALASGDFLGSIVQRKAAKLERMLDKVGAHQRIS